MAAVPALFELGEHLVAVFSVQYGNCSAKMECMYSSEGIVDYTIEYKGRKESREELHRAALLEADVLFKEKILFSLKK
ncbi:hypothetical protein LRR81_18330 [Metabacillus sp. GX 13764]|uniref:hypothetical protein n=1 Tax=Metabacillus kandeliae TaxID=2900151 RepID=UPI001E3B468A|nr:hypothetical protein [Metabacillus kandeliae]MCD7036204.1 hypothetical protein [Metabacillus kandeliae]